MSSIAGLTSSGESTVGVPSADAEEDQEDEEVISLRAMLENIQLGDGDQQDAVPWQASAACTGEAGGTGAAGDVIHALGDMMVAYSTVSGNAHIEEK